MTTRLPRLRRLALLVALGLPCATRAVPSYSLTAFDASQWGASNATLGISGYSIEDFEHTTLATGLLVGWNTTAGNVTPASTIPFTFNGVTQDPNGNAFANGAWDGVNSLVNTRTNQSYVYTDVDNWGNTLLQFTTPVSSLGFSLQQNDQDVGVFINGSSIGTLQSLSGLAPNGGRYGYLRIDGLTGHTITSLELVNGHVGFNDGFVIDHVAFLAIPEPSTYALLLGLTALAVCRSRRRQRISP